MLFATLQRPRRGVLGFLLGLYTASYLLPVMRTPDGTEVLGFQLVWDGVKEIHLGGNKFRSPEGGLSLQAGMANPMFLLALYALFARRLIPAACLSILAFSLGLTAFCMLANPGRGLHLHVGTYVWLASVAAVAFVANLNRRYEMIGR